MESSDPKVGDGHIPPVPETEGRLSVASSSSTSSFNSIVNTNDDIEMEDDDEEEEYEEHKPQLPPMSPQSSSNNLTSATTTETDGTIGSSSSDQLQPFTGYDSNRIPSAVFSRKPTNRMEWSVASNESLFSIHMGNNSFSMGPDMMMPFDFGNEMKPGLNDANAPFGLPTTAEGVENSNDSSRMNSISSNLKEEDNSMIRQQPSPMIPKKDATNHSFDITNNVQEPNSPSGGMIPVSTGGTYSGSDVSNHTRDSSSVTGTHVSRESGTSSSSFAFPLLASESGTKKRLNAAAPEQPTVAIIDDHDRVEEKPKSGPQTVPEAETAAANQANGGEKKTSWLSCFSCFSRFNCKMSNQSGCFAKGNDKEDKVDD
ncbi:uncharacterized protein LOC124925113 [Impatiens glandulifera]|uniref:uncharacterized protein LOC124925113 n=1 Tax=Impatiens glandulifera TaxID=253017 RepID=UPI001FB0D08C|nr:uncharacterized protein LOC124925113 [Impatiens glandulifera]